MDDASMLTDTPKRLLAGRGQPNRSPDGSPCDSQTDGVTISLTPSTTPSLLTVISEANGREHYEEGFCSQDYDADEANAHRAEANDCDVVLEILTSSDSSDSQPAGVVSEAESVAAPMQPEPSKKKVRVTQDRVGDGRVDSAAKPPVKRMMTRQAKRLAQTLASKPADVAVVSASNAGAADSGPGISRDVADVADIASIDSHPFLSSSAVVSRFHVMEKVGEGTFSVVYRAVPKDDALRSVYASVVLKVLTRTCEAHGRILREVQFLNMMQGQSGVSFVSQLVGAIREDAQLVLVLSFHPSDRYSSSLIRSMSIMDVRLYMMSLFSCIAFVHSKGIVHRDIKPSNFLYSMELKKGILIDFGLAQLEQDACQPVSSHRSSRTGEQQGSESSRHKKLPYPRAQRAGTRGFRSPEVLMRSFHQSKALDIWSAGIILLSLLSRKSMVLECHEDDGRALFELMQLFGSDKLEKSAIRCGRVIKCSRNFPEHPLQRMCDTIFPQEAFDLLRLCLDCNPESRITAVDALRHPFFQGVETPQSRSILENASNL